MVECPHCGQRLDQRGRNRGPRSSSPRDLTAARIGLASLAFLFTLLIALSLAPMRSANDAEEPKRVAARGPVEGEAEAAEEPPPPPSPGRVGDTPPQVEEPPLPLQAARRDAPAADRTRATEERFDEEPASGRAAGASAVQEEGPAPTPPRSDPPGEDESPPAVHRAENEAGEADEAAAVLPPFEADDWYESPIRVRRAIKEGCLWLVRQQHAEHGFWSLNPVGLGGDEEYKHLVPATSLALLALQGAIHDGRHSPRFERAIARGHAALARLHADALVKPDVHARAYSPSEAYARALMCLAICDLAALAERSPPVSGKRLKERTLDASSEADAQARLDELLGRQNQNGVDRGGWGYVWPADPRSDASLTGWNVRALVAAERAGLSVPADKLDAAREYLESLWREKGSVRRYIYKHGNLKDYAEPAKAIRGLGGHAQALAGVRLLGGDPQPAGVELIVANREHAGTNAYFAFCGTSALVRLPQWRAWWPRLEEALLASQRRGAPGLDGSWPVDGDAWLEEHGRLCVTCFRLMTLEVPMRAELATRAPTPKD